MKREKALNLMTFEERKNYNKLSNEAIATGTGYSGPIKEFNKKLGEKIQDDK